MARINPPGRHSLPLSTAAVAAAKYRRWDRQPHVALIRRVVLPNFRALEVRDSPTDELHLPIWILVPEYAANKPPPALRVWPFDLSVRRPFPPQFDLLRVCSVPQ